MLKRSKQLFGRPLMGLVLWQAIASTGFAHEGLHEQIVEATRQISLAPANARLYLKRGELYRLHRQWHAALADYDRAARLDDSLDEVEFARGRMYLESRQPGKAKLQLDSFLARNPNHFDAIVVRARALRALRQTAAAVADYSKAISLTLRPRPELYIERARAISSLGVQHQDEALAGLDEGIRRLGSIVTLELLAIDLELSQKRYERALARLDIIIAQAERKEAWLLRRTEIQKMAGRKE